MISININGNSEHGEDNTMYSHNPATGKVIWSGKTSSIEEINAAVNAARKALKCWQEKGLSARILICRAFVNIVEQNKTELAQLISEETGKPIWDSLSEVGAVIAKLDISIEAYQDRSATKELMLNGVSSKLSHKAFGVMAVFGPYNLPCHLPNGHIIPALLAGNTVVFKPSDLTPACGEKMVRYWQSAGLPNGVVNLVQGGKDVGVKLASEDINGLLFTGSVNTGRALHKQFAGKLETMLALELGGNNPMIVEPVSDIDKAAFIIAQSAFISSGQRCTCARRLLVPVGSWGDTLIESLKEIAKTIQIGAFDDDTDPFMGPLVSANAAETVLAQQKTLLSLGGKTILASKQLARGPAFLSPGLIDTTGIDWDNEIFGPLLQVKRYDNFSSAIAIANDTQFGLAAGLISETPELFERFLHSINAGVINLNRPLTGASSSLPFGGLGASGNNRPSAYYAADYCAHPVATQYQLKLGESPLLSSRLCKQSTQEG